MSARNRYDAGLYQVTCPSGRVIEGPPTGRYWVIDENKFKAVLLDWGVDLALSIEQQKIAGKTAFFVDGNALAACFDTNITEELVKELAKRKPLRAVFRDSSFESDSTKINVAQIFKLLSPETEVKCL